MNKTIHLTSLLISAEDLSDALRKDPARKVVLMNWADCEIIEAFNRGEYTDLITTYRPARAAGFKTNADAIVHHNLPIDLHDEPFVKEVNRSSPGAAIIYRYNDHFEYDRVPG